MTYRRIVGDVDKESTRAPRIGALSTSTRRFGRACPPRKDASQPPCAGVISARPPVGDFSRRRHSPSRRDGQADRGFMAIVDSPDDGDSCRGADADSAGRQCSATQAAGRPDCPSPWPRGSVERTGSICGQGWDAIEAIRCQAGGTACAARSVQALDCGRCCGVSWFACKAEPPVVLRERRATIARLRRAWVAITCAPGRCSAGGESRRAGRRSMMCSRRPSGPWWADVVMVTAPPS